MLQEQVPCPTERAFSVLEAIRTQDLPSWAEDRDLRDGMKIIGEGQWVQVRVSQTEPLIRVIAEARDQETVRKLAREYLTRVRRLV